MSPVLKACLLLLVPIAVGVVVRAGSAADEKPPSPVLRHVVFFKFKPGTDEAKLKEIVDGFRALPSKIDVIKDFEWGTDVSVEMKADGFTHCFVVSFKDAKARDVYLPHAAHGEFIKLVGPRLEKVLVFDFVNGK